MDKAKNDALAAGLKRLMEASRPEMLRRLSVVEGAAHALNSGKLTEAIRKPAHTEAHKLAGVLGTYGLQAASRAAHDLEVMLENAATLNLKTMKRLISELRKAIEGK